MKIEQMANTAQPQSMSLNARTPSQQSARERAINALLGTKSQSQETPVANPTSISPEEATGLNAPKTAADDSFEKAKAQALKPNNEALESSESVDAPKAETKDAEAKSEESEPISSQYAILARKEKLLRQREQQLKAKEAEMKAKEETSSKPATPQAPAVDLTKFVDREKLMSDPFGVLTDLGLTYDQLTEAALNGPKPKEIELMNEIKAMREELKSLKGETESTKKSFQEQQEQTYKQAVAQIRNEARSLINNNPNFETVKETQSLEDVVELIERTYKEDGVLLSVEDAAQQVEDYLVEEAMKIARIKKIQQRLMPKSESPKATEKSQTEQPKQPQLKTLTNSVASTRQLSSKERAILAFEGKLNK